MPRPALRRWPRVSMERAIGVSALVFGALVVAVVWCLFLTPIHVTLRHDPEWVPLLRVDGREQKVAAKPVPGSHHVRITNISADNAAVELALPVPDGQPRLRFDQLESVAGQWKSISRGERVESTHPGSEIAMVVIGATPEIPFLDRPDGGRARIRDDGGEREVNLKSETGGWHKVELAPRQILSVATSLADPFGMRFEIRATGSSRGVAVGTLRIGAKAAIRSFEIAAGSPLELTLPAREIVALLVGGMLDFAAVLVLSLLFLLVFALAGSTLASADRSDPFNRSQWMACFAIGLCSFSLIANTTVYFFSARESAFVLGALLLVAAVAGAAIRTRRAGTDSPASSSERLPIAVIMAVALGLWLSFWPLTFVGAGFLGVLQTDSSFYATAANAIQGTPLSPVIAADGLIGNGMRSIDLALVASLASIGGLTTGRIWMVLCMALMIVPPLASYYLMRDWLCSTPVAILTAVSVALSAPMAGLFFQSYFVQYVTSAVLYLNLYTALPFIRSLQRRSVPMRTSFVHALTGSVAVLLYPYFAIVPVATAGVAIWTLRNDRTKLMQHIGLFVAMSLAVGNIGYFFMANHAATGQFVDGLNAIARYIVFPFHDQPRFLAFVFGLAPFHADSEAVRMLMAESSASPIAEGLLGYLSMAERIRVVVVVGLIGAIYLFSLAAGRKILLDGFGKVIAASLVGYLLMLPVARYSSGLYAQCKLTWTLATLIPVFVVPALALGVFKVANDRGYARRRNGLVKVLATGALCVFLTGNLISKVAEPMPWFVAPSPFLKASTNSSVAADLSLLENWHPPSIAPETRFAFGEAVPGIFTGNQSSLVRAGHIYSMLIARGHVCANCKLSTKLLEFTGFEPADAGAIDAGMLVMFGERPQAGVRGWFLALSGEQMSIYFRETQYPRTDGSRAPPG